MIGLRRVYGLCAVLVCLVALSGCSDPNKRLLGDWAGTIYIPEQARKMMPNLPASVSLKFHFTKQDDGKIAGSLEQGAVSIKMDSVTFADDTVNFTVNAARLTYTGKVNSDGSGISGTIKQAGNETALALKRVEATK